MCDDQSMRQHTMFFNFAVRFTAAGEVLEKYGGGGALDERDRKELAWTGEIWRQMDWESPHHETTNELHEWATHLRPEFYGACIAEGIYAQRDKDKAYLFLAGQRLELDEDFTPRLRGVVKRLKRYSDDRLPQGNI